MDPATIINGHLDAWDGGNVPPDSMLHWLVRYFRWTEADGCLIRNVHSEIVPLRLNQIQQLELATMMDQAAAARPIRIRIGKARKGGSSTLVQTLYLFLVAYHPNYVAVTIAHQADATEEIFAIAKQAAKGPILGANIGNREIRFDDLRSRYHCQTAGGVAVGAGGTPTLLHLSEAAKWEANRVATWYNSTIAVPNVPETIIVEESTFRGREEFWGRFEAAREPGNPYAAIFIPWWLDDRCTTPTNGHTLALDDEEKMIARQAAAEGVELSHEAFQWRRDRIAELGIRWFRQEFPTSPEEAVECAADLVLPGLADCVIDELPFEYDYLVSCMVPGTLPGGVDFGYHDATVILTGAYVDQVAYVVDVARFTQQLAADCPQHMHPGHTYFCGPTEVSAREELQAAVNRNGDRRIQVRPIQRARGELARGFTVGEWTLLADWIRLGRLKILRSASAQLLVEGGRLLWNPTTGMPDMVRGDAWGHFDTLDALRYMVVGCNVGAPVRIDPRLLERTTMPRRQGLRM